MSLTGFEQLARALIRSADPDERAAHSFADYHAKGVLYLNLLRAPDLTCKLYVLEGCEPHEWLVAPHNHAYPFHSTVLSGEMRHGLFAKDSDAGELRTRFNVRSDGARFAFRGATRLRLLEARTLRQGTTYYLAPDEIHTIGVPGTTVLFLCQYQRERLTTQLYTENAAAPNVSGLYRPVTPETYAERLGHVRQLLGVA